MPYRSGKGYEKVWKNSGEDALLESSKDAAVDPWRGADSGKSRNAFSGKSGDGFARNSAAEEYRRIFDKPKTASAKTKPRAVAVAKRTPAENRPFIAGGGMGGLTKGMPVPGKVDYGVGDRVSHVKYGEGTVTKLESTPKDYQVTVVFDGAGQKIMYAAFAKLKKL